ncbi:class I SAM-dependent methyltransferase [Flavobacteriaceae bacterium F89]|uniref:Class I SAM-dependent methyltransferase n=1 Tax=Cerina litoralis TaxID=2874477 RepID=A0AAE3JMW3_9FLAO|nr:class I SAM-dependent methyltransferase [Cerina litoralis]MCG2459209.1 class I SAM-dependent methyltransferase [Cerina litoralis]
MKTEDLIENVFLSTNDFSVTGEDFQLLYNEELEMLVTHPQPQSLDRYYASEDYISHTDSSRGLVNFLYQRIKKHNLQRKVKMIESFANGNKTLLDVGAGTGDFLVAAKESGWTVKGVEPNPTAKQRAAEKGIELETGLQSLQANTYQIITLWHVLEHLPNLDKQIKSLSSHLEDSGILIVAVPNFKSFDAKFYKRYWAAFDVPRHLWHFSRTSIEKLFMNHSLKVVQTNPMVFDAFYVSLLSEKYKSGKQSFVKGFLVGLWSNIRAWGNKEYSSIVYVLQKRH